jgi:hypothetical protein
MLKTFAVVSALTVVALAQSNSTLIPDGISAGCTQFLNELNSDSQLATCATALTSALSAFAPGSTATPSAATITSALTNICSDSITTSCPANLIGTKLSSFYSACSAELTSSPNSKVLDLYDILYAITPLKESVCGKDDSGNWCVLSADPADGTSAESLQKSLYTESNQVIVPNTAAFSSSYLPFLFLTPDLATEKLCQPCTRSVLISYISFESDNPYGPGLANSQLLKNQGALYDAVSTKCGATFMDSQVKAAGGIKSGLGGSSAAAPAAEFKSLMAAVAGLMTLAVAVL